MTFCMYGYCEGFVVCGWLIEEDEISRRFMERYEVELYWMNHTRNAGKNPLYGKRCVVHPETGAAYLSEADRKLVQNAYNQFDAMVIATNKIGYLCCIGGDLPYRNDESDVEESDDDKIING